MKDLFKQAQYKHIGPGGMRCPCCNDFRTKHGKCVDKRLNRIARRALKYIKEINEANLHEYIDVGNPIGKEMW